MDFPLKRLSEHSYNTSDSIDICLQDCFSESSSCLGPCFSVCKLNCPNKIPSQHHKNTNKFLILGVVLSSIFFVVFCVSIYYKFFCSQSSRIRRSSQLQGQRNENQDFFDEDHTHVLDHPVWYINTVGLQPSVINSISVFQYKRCDGLVDVTECSVCLNEFQENEALRLLPKCSHAFHVPCIDTWLRSHTNCPVCRAPIVANSARAESTDSDNESSRVGIEEENEISNRDEEEEEIEPIRRSVSLDSLSGLRSCEDGSCDSAMNSYTLSRAESESDVGIVQKRVESNQSLFKLMASSSFERASQICPSSLMKRSFSCSGKLFLSRYTGKNKSILPL